MALLLRKNYRLNRPLPHAVLNLGHPLCKDMVGCWLMNENGGLYLNDLVCRNRATIQSLAQVTRVHSAMGQVAKFSKAVGGWANAGNYSNVLMGLGDFSAMILFYATANQSDMNWIDKRDTGSPYTGWVVARYSTGNNLNLEINGTGVSERSVNVITCSSACQPLNVWTANCVSARRNGSAYVFQNGKVLGSASLATSIAYNVQGSNPLKIGGHHGDNNTYFFGGSMAYVYLWKRFISLEEHQALFQAPYQIVQTPLARTYFLPTVPPPPTSSYVNTTIYGIIAGMHR